MGPVVEANCRHRERLVHPLGVTQARVRSTAHMATAQVARAAFTICRSCPPAQLGKPLLATRPALALVVEGVVTRRRI